MAESNSLFSGMPPKDWVHLKLTKKLTIINAQKKSQDLDIGTILYGIPTATKGKYIYTTEGVNYELVVGKNAEIYVDKNDNNSDSDKTRNQQFGSYMFVGGALLLTYIVYKIIKSK
jgi:hypothetical protein